MEVWGNTKPNLLPITPFFAGNPRMAQYVPGRNRKWKSFLRRPTAR